MKPIRGNTDEEELRRRRGNTVEPGQLGEQIKKGQYLPRSDTLFPKSGYFAAYDRLWQTGAAPVGNGMEMRHRFIALANGAQSSVVKVAGFGGSAGARRLMSYISRGGDIDIENERGEVTRGRGAIADIVDEWAPVLTLRQASQDLVTFEIVVEWASMGSSRELTDLAIVQHAFADRAFAFKSISNDKTTTIDGLAVLQSGRHGRLAIGDHSAELLGRRLEQISDEVAKVTFRFLRSGHGVRFATAGLVRLVDGEEKNARQTTVRDERDVPVSDRNEAKALVQRRWRPLLRSLAPRDTLHLIISAKAGTDPARFDQAVRSFLSQEFLGHHYAFAIHDAGNDPKPHSRGGARPHIHAHVVIATLSDFGDRMNVWISDLSRWREKIAESARASGISMERVERGDTLAAPAYSLSQVQPVYTPGRTQHRGTSPAAQKRYDEKRSEKPSSAESSEAKAYAASARETWQDLTGQNYSEAVRRFALEILGRFPNGDGLTAPVSPRNGPARQTEERQGTARTPIMGKIAQPIRSLERGLPIGEQTRGAAWRKHDDMRGNSLSGRQNEGSSFAVDPNNVSLQRATEGRHDELRQQTYRDMGPARSPSRAAANLELNGSFSAKAIEASNSVPTSADIPQPPQTDRQREKDDKQSLLSRKERGYRPMDRDGHER